MDRISLPDVTVTENADDHKADDFAKAGGLCIKGVSKCYPARREAVAVLNDINLTLEAGSIAALIGPNGAGKTSLIKVMCGLVVPDQGNVTLNGRNLAFDADMRRRIGVVLEGDRNFYPALSVIENLRYFTRLMNVAEAVLPRRMDDSIRDYGLEDVLHRPVRHLSRGQKQRLSLALGTIHQPKYLILDEPTLGLDPIALEYLENRLRDWRSRGVGVMVASHDLSILGRLADRVVMISKGRIRHQVDFRQSQISVSDRSQHLLEMFKTHLD
jgi:ABC-2 type transport system ATP-binding protein